jgi:hypothetical protein
MITGGPGEDSDRQGRRGGGGEGLGRQGDAAGAGRGRRLYIILYYNT